MNHIAADTADEQILSASVAARKALLKLAAESVESEYLQGGELVKLAQRVKNAEAVAVAALRYRDMLKRSDDKAERLLHLAGLLANGADDTWSGRGNDSNREAHDAVRAFAEGCIDDIRYGN